MSERFVSLLPLAQVTTRMPKRQETAWSLALLLVIVMLAFIIAGIVIYIIRGRALRNGTTTGDTPLTLAEVRRMHREGEIDEEEMERLKAIVTAQARKSLTKKPEEKEA